MNAREHQKRIVAAARKLKINLDPLVLSGQLGKQIGLLSTTWIISDPFARRKILIALCRDLMLWCDAYESYVSFDEADTYISQLQDCTDGMNGIGLMYQNLARIFILHSEEVPTDDEQWAVSARRLFNNFALTAKVMDGRNYVVLLDMAYASLRDTRKET